MASLKKVLITTRTVHETEYRDPRDAISQDWIVFLEQAGYLPILLPTSSIKIFDYMDQLSIDAVILSNGENVQPSRYGEKDDGISFSRQRDELEFQILKLCIERKIPTLAVCRGMQVLNTFLGGKLSRLNNNQDIRHVTISHEVQILDPILSKRNGSETGLVNSYHNYGIRQEDLGKGVSPIAIAENGVIEAMICEDAPILALQWHPERDGPQGYIQSEFCLDFLKENQ
jgi:putative glutamine amidotransferase